MCERSMQERKSHRRHGGGALLSVLRELSARTDLADVGAQREPRAVVFCFLTWRCLEVRLQWSRSRLVTGGC